MHDTLEYIGPYYLHYTAVGVIYIFRTVLITSIYLALSSLHTEETIHLQYPDCLVYKINIRLKLSILIHIKACTQKICTRLPAQIKIKRICQGHCTIYCCLVI